MEPVGFEFDGSYFYGGGQNPTNTRKYRNLRAGNDKVALVVDDLVPDDPWNPRGIRIYGTAEFVEREGMFGPGVYMHIIPAVSWSWNVDRSAFTVSGFEVHKTVHERN